MKDSPFVVRLLLWLFAVLVLALACTLAGWLIALMWLDIIGRIMQ